METEPISTKPKSQTGERLNRGPALVEARRKANGCRKPQAGDDSLEPRILNGVEPMQCPGKGPHHRAGADRQMVRSLGIQTKCQRQDGRRVKTHDRHAQ